MHSNTIFSLSKVMDADVFVGLDVGKRSIALTTRDRLGLGKSLKMAYDPQILLSYVRIHLECILKP